MSDQPADLDQVFRRLSEIFRQLHDYPRDDPEVRRKLEEERDSLRERVQAFPERGDRTRSEHQLRAERDEHRRQIMDLHDQTIRQSGFTHNLTSSIRRDATLRSGFKVLNDSILDAGGAVQMRKRIEEITAELGRRELSD